MRRSISYLLAALGLALVACGDSSSPSERGSGDGGPGGPDAEAAASADGGTKSCAEPPSCPGIDRSQTPEITCLTPDEVARSAGFTLHIFGRHLQDTGGANTKVSFDGPSIAGGNVFNGAPVSPCHLTVEVPAGFLTSAGQVKVHAITASQSAAVELAVK